jgi:C1A family cysteine protease
MKKNLLTILILIAIINVASFGQQLHKMGLLPEEINKNPKMHKAEVTSVQYSLPSSVDNSAHMPAVGDQGNQNCCVAWAVGYYYKTYQEWQTNGWSITDSNHIFSPAFIYNHINGGQDSGSYFSDAFLLLSENGCATLAECPYNVSNYTSWPSESVYRDAINYRSNSASYILTNSTDGINAIKQLLANGNLAILAINVYENFEKLNSTNDTYCVRYASGSNLGGHAITFVGYDDNKQTADGKGAFKMINQWGTSWGVNGYCWMSYQAVMSTTLTQGYAYYTTNKGQYSPKVIVSTQITHPNKNLLNLSFGVGSTSSPTYSTKFFNFYMNTLPHRSAGAFPGNKIDFDLSDGSAYLETSTNNNVFLSAKSSVAGTVNNLTVNDLRTSSTITSTETPKTIPGNNTTVYVNTSLIPGTVQLSSPLNNSTGVTLPVKLKWTKSERAISYRLQFSLDSTFATTITDTSGLGDTTLSVNSLSNLKKYYWRVSAKNTTGTGSWSAVWNLTTLTSAPSAPVLLSPITAAVNQPAALMLYWNASAGAASYRVQVSTNETFSTFIVNDSNVTTTYKQLSGLANNTKYYWRINAKNTFGISGWSTVWNFTTKSAVPTAPVLLLPATAALNQATELKLSWNASTGAVSYRVQVSTSDSFNTLIVNDSTVATTSRQLTGLLNNTKYFWRVNAKNTSGTSNWSTVWNFTTIAVTPQAPVLLSPVTLAVSQATTSKLYWNASTGATSYRVQVSTRESFNTLVVNDSSVTANSRQLTGLLNNTKYFWRVNAKNASGTSGWSNVWNFTTLSLVPSAPVLLSPSTFAVNQATALKLSWNISTVATSYRVQVSTSESFNTLVVNDSSVTASSRQLTGLLNNTKYFWRVNAKNASGTSNWSTVWNFTTSGSAPLAPVLLSPAISAANQATALKLSWNASSGAVSYRVQVSASESFGTLIVNDSTVTATSGQLAGLLNNTKYFWRVNAKNASGTSGWSSVWNFTTLVSSAPVLLSPSTAAVNQATTLKLSWNASTGAVSYRVQVSTNESFNTFIVNDSTVTATSGMLVGLSGSTKYYWRVNAKNSSGTSSWSTVWNFTTIAVTHKSIVLMAQLKPSNVAQQGTKVILNWENTSSAEDSCIIERAAGDSINFSEIAKISANKKTFTDNSVQPGTKYFYRIATYNNIIVPSESNMIAVDNKLSGTTGEKLEFPKEFRLNQNYPNPFNPSTMISYALPFSSNVKIVVYNIIGEKIRELLNTKKNAGYYELKFDMAGLTSGVYLYLMEAKSTDGKSEFRSTKKMILLK